MPSARPEARAVCLPANIQGKELIKFIRLYSGGSVWRSEAAFGTVVLNNAFGKRGLLCIVIFINGFMQKSFDISGGNGNGIEPFFPVTFNPSRSADFCVHRNTASCVLSSSKTFPMLKTTCPCRGQKTSSEVGVFV